MLYTLDEINKEPIVFEKFDSNYTPSKIELFAINLYKTMLQHGSTEVLMAETRKVINEHLIENLSEEARNGKYIYKKKKDLLKRRW